MHNMSSEPSRQVETHQSLGHTTRIQPLWEGLQMVWMHMVLNSDVLLLNVPLICRIWLKYNEVLSREGRWSHSHYCLVISCQAADDTVRYISSMSKRCHEIWLQIYDHVKDFLSLQQTSALQHWLCIIFFPPCYILSFIARYSGFVAVLQCLLCLLQCALYSEAEKLAHQ